MFPHPRPAWRKVSDSRGRNGASAPSFGGALKSPPTITGRDWGMPRDFVHHVFDLAAVRDCDCRDDLSKTRDSRSRGETRVDLDRTLITFAWKPFGNSTAA